MSEAFGFEIFLSCLFAPCFRCCCCCISVVAISRMSLILHALLVVYVYYNKQVLLTHLFDFIAFCVVAAFFVCFLIFSFFIVPWAFYCQEADSNKKTTNVTIQFYIMYNKYNISMYAYIYSWMRVQTACIIYYQYTRITQQNIHQKQNKEEFFVLLLLLLCYVLLQASIFALFFFFLLQSRTIASALDIFFRLYVCLFALLCFAFVLSCIMLAQTLMHSNFIEQIAKTIGLWASQCARVYSIRLAESTYCCFLIFP